MSFEEISVHSALIESIDDLRTPIASTDIEVTQLGSGRMQGHLTRATIGGIAFSVGCFSNSLRAAGVFDCTHTLIGVLQQPSDAVTDSGVQVLPGDVMWSSPGSDHDMRYFGRASFVGLLIRPQDIAAMMATEGWLGDETTWMQTAR